MNELDTFLRDLGLGEEVRKPLTPDPQAPITRTVAQMRERMKASGWLLARECEPAFRLLETASLFDFEKSKAPSEFLKSVDTLLEYYISSAVEAAKAPGADQRQVVQGLKSLIKMALQIGYVCRSMELDGRWEQLTQIPT